MLASADGCLLVYSIYSRPSFEELAVYYQEVVYAKGKDPLSMILIGNHCDRTAARRVTYEKGRDMSRQFGCKFAELYPNSPRDLSQAFFDLIGDIVARETPQPPVPTIVEPEAEDDRSETSTQDTVRLGRSRSLRESIRGRLSPDTVKNIVRRRSLQDRSNRRSMSLAQRLRETNLLPERQTGMVDR
jgi:hypothetical protein